MRKNKLGKIPRKFYIAHSILERFEVKEMCKRLQAMGIETINPFYLPDGSWRPERPEIRKIDEGKLDPYFIQNRAKAKAIVEADLRHIEEADGVIAFLKEASIGTAMEIFYCSWVLHKPVYVITEKAFKHAWIMALATERFKTEEHFKKWYRRTFITPFEKREEENGERTNSIANCNQSQQSL